MIRIIIRIDHANPDGSTLAPTYRTVEVNDPALEAALKPPHTYAACAVVGAETVEARHD